MDEEFGGYQGGSESIVEGVHGGERGDGGIREGVWEGAETDHAENLDAVVFESQSESFEAFIFPHKTMYIA